MRIMKPLILLMILTGISWGQQYYFPKKSLFFGQVAVGGGIETLLTVTNRGTSTYSGTMMLNTGQGQAWNPVINGVPVVNGTLNVSLPAGATRSFNITSTGPVASGALGILGNDLSQTNFIEGTLTYFLKSGSTVTDSVGVSPSTVFFFATLPFEDFKNIALALVNGTSTTTLVTLTLFSEDGPQVAGKDISLGSGWHMAQFLSEIFPGVNLGRGRLEISSDVPIFGTALTLIAGQYSSLPLLPSPYSLTFTTQYSGYTGAGNMSLWTEDSFVKGIMQFTQMNGSPITPEAYLVYGQMQGSTLTMMVYGAGSVFQHEMVCLFIQIDLNSVSGNSYSGPFYWILLGYPQPPQQGTFTATRIG